MLSQCNSRNSLVTFRHKCYDPLRLNSDHVRKGGMLVVDAVIRAMRLPPDTKTTSGFGRIDPKAEESSDIAPVAMGALRRICASIHEPLDTDVIDIRERADDRGAEIAADLLYIGNQQQYSRPSS